MDSPRKMESPRGSGNDLGSETRSGSVSTDDGVPSLEVQGVVWSRRRQKVEKGPLNVPWEALETDEERMWWKAQQGPTKKGVLKMERRQKKGVIGLAGRRKRRMVAEIDGRGCLSLHPCNNNPAGSKETGSKLINLPEWYFDETKSKQFALWNRMNQGEKVVLHAANMLEAQEWGHLFELYCHYLTLKPRIDQWTAPSILIDGHFSILEANETFEACLRCDTTDLVGKSTSEIVVSGQISTNIIGTPQHVMLQRPSGDRRLLSCNVLVGVVWADIESSAPSSLSPSLPSPSSSPLSSSPSSSPLQSTYRASVDDYTPSRDSNQDGSLGTHSSAHSLYGEADRIVICLCPNTLEHAQPDLIPPLTGDSDSAAYPSFEDSTSSDDEMDRGADEDDNTVDIETTDEGCDRPITCDDTGTSPGETCSLGDSRSCAAERHVAEKIMEVLSNDQIVHLKSLGIHIDDICLKSSRVGTATPNKNGSLRRNKSRQVDELRCIVPPMLDQQRDDDVDIRKIEQLGSGYASQVWEVVVNGWSCAMKEIEISKLDPSVLRRCEQELDVMRTVPQHPNLCTYLGSRRRDGKLQIFLTKYSSNLRWKLNDMLENHEFFVPAEACRIAMDVVRGLMALHNERLSSRSQHSYGFVHRDVKSDNILLMLNERDDVHSAALADFDACFSLSAQNRGQTLIGTPGYTAPELLEKMSANVVADCDELNLPIMDRGSYELDVYGFGMVLYELMERRRPYYQHRTPLAVAQCILKGEPPRLSQRVVEDTRWCGVIELHRKCVALRPCDRPSLKKARRYLLEMMDDSAYFS